MPAAPLTMFEREEIRAGLERQDSVTELARRLGRHSCTISAEVNRNGGRDLYGGVGFGVADDARRREPWTAATPGADSPRGCFPAKR